MYIDAFTSHVDYEAALLSRNIVDGFHCLFGIQPAPSLRHYNDHHSDIATCTGLTNVSLVLGFAVANILILECVDRLLNMRLDLVGRSMTLAVFAAFIALSIYDRKMNNGYEFTGLIDVLSILVLVAGMEMYSRDSEPDSEVQLIPESEAENPTHDDSNQFENSL